MSLFGGILGDICVEKAHARTENKTLADRQLENKTYTESLIMKDIAGDIQWMLDGLVLSRE